MRPADSGCAPERRHFYAVEQRADGRATLHDFDSRARRDDWLGLSRSRGSELSCGVVVERRACIWSEFRALSAEGAATVRHRWR